MQLKERHPVGWRFSLVGTGRAHSLKGSSPFQAYQGELLAGRQGCPTTRPESEGITTTGTAIYGPVNTVV